MQCGYRYVSVEGKRIAEHRHVVQLREGRTLSSNEIVHHIDGDPLNNDPNNLAILSRSEHQRLHQTGARRKRWTPDEKARACELFNAGMRIIQIARLLGRSYFSTRIHVQAEREARGLG
jgi:hypothetical protein